MSAPRRYPYVGPPEVAARVSGGRGEAIPSRDALVAWVRANARELAADGFTATYVVTDDGAWRLAPRRSEHVACAGGGAVLAAGEVVLSRDARVVEASNLSTGIDGAADPHRSDGRGRADGAPPGLPVLG